MAQTAGPETAVVNVLDPVAPDPRPFGVDAEMPLSLDGREKSAPGPWLGVNVVAGGRGGAATGKAVVELATKG